MALPRKGEGFSPPDPARLRLRPPSHTPFTLSIKMHRIASAALVERRDARSQR
jgi:hypothetical protein